MQDKFILSFLGPPFGFEFQIFSQCVLIMIMIIIMNCEFWTFDMGGGGEDIYEYVIVL